MSSFERLGKGELQVDGLSGQIRWRFECEFQRSLYELMQCRWRAKVCEQCGRFFVALKTAQRFCSARCTEDTKRKRVLTWWNAEGKQRRAKKARKK
jgi:protein-arginine kinase activator protein McsA